MEIEIRPLKIEDAYTSVIWRNDKEVFKYTGHTYSNEVTIESELNWIKNVIPSPNEYRCAIIVDGEYVGNTYLTDIINQSARFHIFIGNKNYWGKGVAQQATKLMIDYAKNVLKLSSIRLTAHIENDSAISLYKKMDFQIIGKENNRILMEYLLTD